VLSAPTKGFFSCLLALVSLDYKGKDFMKIAICYPPLENPKGTPLLSQNRQFQWFTNPLTAYSIYPVVPASAATLLKSRGYEVVWLDGVAEKWSWQEFVGRLSQEKPDIVVLETKTPVVKKHWDILRQIKKLSVASCQPARQASPGEAGGLSVVLVGDHVTALPEESFYNSPVDYVLTGGDYDFLLLNLCEHLTKNAVLEPGIWYRDDHAIKNTGPFALNHDLNLLPPIDRELTKWKLYAHKNSNFKKTPGTYTMFGRDCWWGRCSFCSWTTLYPGCDYRTFSVEKALDEAQSLVEKLGVREIMDDSGTFPVGEWLHQFCLGLIQRGLNKKVTVDCNMRFNANLTQEDYNLMGRAGFRFILYGLESASQATLDRINKNLRVEQIEQGLVMAKKAGLEPHITIMVGYPWETRDDVEKTLAMARDFFRRGLVDSMQATIVIPYPGTPLFKECQENGWLLTEDWDRYDMREPIMKTDMAPAEIQSKVRGLYSSFMTPSFLWRKVKAIRSLDDLKFIVFSGLKYLSKLLDFWRS